jgi:hypothetical protein
MQNLALFYGCLCMLCELNSVFLHLVCGSLLPVPYAQCVAERGPCVPAGRVSLVPTAARAPPAGRPHAGVVAAVQVTACGARTHTCLCRACSLDLASRAQNIVVDALPHHVHVPPRVARVLGRARIAEQAVLVQRVPVGDLVSRAPCCWRRSTLLVSVRSCASEACVVGCAQLGEPARLQLPQLLPQSVRPHA